MLRPTRLTSSALGLSVWALASGCGPSVQAVREGTLRFEHCYRLDLNNETASPHRRACWQEWTSQYTYGQSRDRIEYARRRARSLAAGDPDRPELKLTPRHNPKERQFYLSVPASSSAPPPPIATRTYSSPDAGPRPRTTSDDCAQLCKSSFEDCREPCQANDGAPAAGASAVGGAPDACSGCEPDYKRCMVRCYE
ncbi:MAG: hypothetical protein SFV15_10185 [Polyangiaceae bacterium]|nr:hypothetical protein [Polyangiaceae bacterium]